MFRVLLVVFSFVTMLWGLPVSQPLYPDNQYVARQQAIPNIFYNNKPRAQGLQQFATQPIKQTIQQVLLQANLQRQRPVSGPLYLHQIPSKVSVPQAHQYVPQKAPQPQQIRYVPQQQYRPQEEPQEEPEQREKTEEYDPNPSYQFGFNVKDDLYTNYQNRKEQRDGNKITGSYSVVDSDGFVRTVTYTADPKEGFKAQVSREPTNIVVKIPQPNPQFQQQPKQYVQQPAPRRHPQQEYQLQRQQPQPQYQQ